MTPHKRSAILQASRPHRSEQFKDEVYRQMFRLEASRPGAEMDLALALLRAWMAAESASDSCEERQWLKKICPICLVMIESARESAHASNPSLQ
jgi:hypothetical protein